MERQLTLRMSANLATKLDKVARHEAQAAEVVRLALEQFWLKPIPKWSRVRSNWCETSSAAWKAAYLIWHNA
jgi:hypothetical protein